jgi:hypothetical protein
MQTSVHILPKKEGTVSMCTSAVVIKPLCVIMKMLLDSRKVP